MIKEDHGSQLGPERLDYLSVSLIIFFFFLNIIFKNVQQWRQCTVWNVCGSHVHCRRFVHSHLVHLSVPFQLFWGLTVFFLFGFLAWQLTLIVMEYTAKPVRSDVRNQSSDILISCLRLHSNWSTTVLPFRRLRYAVTTRWRRAMLRVRELPSDWSMYERYYSRNQRDRRLFNASSTIHAHIQ